MRPWVGPSGRPVGVADFVRANAIDPLSELVELVGERAIAQVYLSEINHLPEADRKRLRWKQRKYVEAWAHF